MIRSIRHKGLKRLHEDDNPRGVSAENVDKLGDILARLDAAFGVEDMICQVFGCTPSRVN